MKLIILCSFLMIMFIPVAVFPRELQTGEAQQPQNRALAREVQEREREIQLQQLEAEMILQQRRQELELLELQHQEDEMNNQREIQKLELEERRIALENGIQENSEDVNPILLIIVVINILCAVWVYLDIQNRTHESGIWIVIALLTGLLGTLVYAIVRLGNPTKSKA